MKKNMLAILTLLFATVTTASAFDLTVGTSASGTITFQVNGANVITANEGDAVTINIAPSSGYVVTSVTAEAYTSWNSARAASIDMLASVELTKSAENQYTFKMPRADVEVNATYEIQINTEAEEAKDETKYVSNVKLDMKLAEGETPTTVAGVTTIPVVIENIEIPAQTDATASAPKEITVIVSGTIQVGNNVFVVKEIKADAFKSSEPTAVVTKVVLPETEQPLKIAAGAMKPNGKVIEVETPLTLLDDYALMASLKENFLAKKISATVQAPNRYWSFSSGVDVQVPEGISVYRAFSENGTVRILPIDEANETKVVKANNGVLLSCDNGVGGNAYEIVAKPGGQKSGTTPATTDAASYAGNAMVPVIQATNYAAGGFYILKNNVFHTIAGNTSKVPACKAVFSLDKANQ